MMLRRTVSFTTEQYKLWGRRRERGEKVQEIT